MNRYVIEFRNGSFFVDPAADHGGPLDKAMLFDSEEAAREYVDREVPWVWFNGGMVCTVESRLAIVSRLPEALQ